MVIMSFTIASRLNKIQLYSDFRCSSSTGYSARRMGAVFVTFIALSLRSALVSSRHCAHSCGPSSVGHNKWLSPGAYSGVLMDCRSRNLTEVPRYVRNGVTELDLSKNNISTIREDDFVEMTNAIQSTQWYWMAHRETRLYLTNMTSAPHSGIVLNG